MGDGCGQKGQEGYEVKSIILWYGGNRWKCEKMGNWERLR